MSPRVARLTALLPLLWAACRPAPPPDVLLVVLDTVRADHLVPYGYPLATSSTLEALAGRGVLFEDATAPAPWTWPSHASLFTGEPPWIHGAEFVSGAREVGSTGALPVRPMRTDLPTLAERLAGLGYETVALSGNELLHPDLGLTRGFGRVELGGDGEVVAHARELLARPATRPLFLFVNFISAHEPYDVADAVPWSARHRRTLTEPWIAPYVVRPGGIEGLSLTARSAPGAPSLEQAIARGDLPLGTRETQLLKDLYDGELVRLDAALADVVEAWVGSGRTGVVAVTADHGEYLGEHGRVGHGRTLHREVLQVPLVLVAPGRVPVGRRIVTPVQMQDLYATILELAGDEVGERFTLLDAVAGSARPGPIVAAAVIDPRGRAAGVDPPGSGSRYYREGTRLLVDDDGGERRFYDLAADPRMSRPLEGDEAPPALRELALRAGDAFEAAAPPAELSPSQREALRERMKALGYLE